MINYERQFGVALYKEVLFRRGILRTRVCRAPGREMDDADRAELDAILVDIEDLDRA